MSTSDNPFTYWERILLVTSALMADGVSADKYSFVPFPIHEPAAISEFVPFAATMYTTIYDEWNREKMRRLQDVGYEVIALWERSEKAYSGAAVRDAMRAGDGTKLLAMLPAGTYRALVPLLELRKQEESM